MSYIKFLDSDEHYEAKVMPFTTQHGVNAIRIISDPIELNESGFMYYDSQDMVIGDYSEYTHHYADNSYSVEHDEPTYGSGSDGPLPPSPLAMMQGQIAAVNRYVGAVSEQVQDEIAKITPYTETKTAYIDDTDIEFITDVQGVITVNAVNRDNETVPTTYERDGNKITVLFEPLVAVTDVTISIS